MTIAIRAAALCMLALAAPAAALAQDAECDRDCLDGFAAAYLDSLAANDVSELALAEDVRVTEDAVEIAPGEGFWTRTIGLQTRRLTALDPDWGVAAGLAVMNADDGTQSLLAYRLKIKDGAISEIEQFVVDDRDEDEEGGNVFGGNYADREILQAPRDEFRGAVDPMVQNSRTELIQLVQYYPDGLKAGSFEAVEAPFAEGAERIENGTITAGPRCRFNDTCQDMLTQPSPTRPTLRERILAVDEHDGIVFMWMDWVQQSGGRTLEVYEAFRIRAGKIEAVDAFIEHGDPDVYPGWPVTRLPE